MFVQCNEINIKKPLIVLYCFTVMFERPNVDDNKVLFYMQIGSYSDIRISEATPRQQAVAAVLLENAVTPLIKVRLCEFLFELIFFVGMSYEICLISKYMFT